MKIYSIFDKKAMTYGPLMCFPQDVMAIRAIEMEISHHDSVMSSYPYDFVLVLLGTFDDELGTIIPFEVPQNIFECANAVKRSVDNE